MYEPQNIGPRDPQNQVSTDEGFEELTDEEGSENDLPLLLDEI